MAKLIRYAQKPFGSTAGTNKMATFGSLAAGTPARFSGTTITPALVQAISNYLQGWSGAVIGNASPALEDMNAVCYLFSYQLGYILQTGVQEWNATTTYYIGSLANDGFGNLYCSIANANVGNALSDTANWQPCNGFNEVSGTGSTTLPDATKFNGQRIEYVKTDSNATTRTFLTVLSQTMSGVASGGYTLVEQYSFVAFRSNGSNWFIVAAG